MRLQDALHLVTRVAFDTAPLIYFLEGQAQYLAKMTAIVNHIEEEGISCFTTVISLVEALQQPFSTGNVALQRAYLALLLENSSLQTLPVSVSIATEAALLRAKYRLKTPDAIQIAGGIQAGCQVFITNDKTLERVQEISVIVLDNLVV